MDCLVKPVCGTDKVAVDARRTGPHSRGYCDLHYNVRFGKPVRRRRNRSANVWCTIAPIGLSRKIYGGPGMVSEMEGCETRHVGHWNTV